MPNEVRRNPRWANMPVTRISCAALSETLPKTHINLANAYFADREAFDYLLKPASYTASWATFDEAVTAAPSEPVTEMRTES